MSETRPQLRRAELEAELMCREQEIAALLEPLRKLVEGRYNPTCRDRSEEFSCSGQWTVWLTRAEHEHYRDLLASLTTVEPPQRIPPHDPRALETKRPFFGG